MLQLPHGQTGCFTCTTYKRDTVLSAPSCNIRTVTATGSLCLICLILRCGGWCGRLRERKHLAASAPTTDERRRQDRWYFTCYETMQLITTLPRVLTQQTRSSRWRLIMWLKGTAAVSGLLTIHVLRRKCS